MIFRNARLIFSDGIREGLEIVTQQGKIAEIRQQTNAPETDVVDLAANYLAPGFVDLHVHGAFGRDTMEASEAAFRAICDCRVSGGHSDASEDEARAALTQGMCSVTHIFNCMSSARRRGVYRVAGLLEFALGEPTVLCELIADGYHVSATLMKMLYRAKRGPGICLVTDATAGAGLPDGSRFSLFGNDCIVEGGVCLLADRSALAGSSARMGDLVQTMGDEVT